MISCLFSNEYTQQNQNNKIFKQLFIIVFSIIYLVVIVFFARKYYNKRLKELNKIFNKYYKEHFKYFKNAVELIKHLNNQMEQCGNDINDIIELINKRNDIYTKLIKNLKKISISYNIEEINEEFDKLSTLKLNSHENYLYKIYRFYSTKSKIKENNNIHLIINILSEQCIELENSLKIIILPSDKNDNLNKYLQEINSLKKSLTYKSIRNLITNECITLFRLIDKIIDLFSIYKNPEEYYYFIEKFHNFSAKIRDVIANL